MPYVRVKRKGSSDGELVVTPSARRRHFRRLELAVLYAPKGKRAEAQTRIKSERLSDLRAAADRTRDGWTPPEPEQGDMFAGRSP